MRIFITFVVLVLAIATESLGRECHPLLTSDNEAFEYVTAVIDGFGYAKQAVDQVQQGAAPVENSTSPFEAVTGLLVSLKRANEDYECASTLVRDFTHSQDETIAISAKTTALGYLALELLQEEGMRLLREHLEGGISDVQLADGLSDITVEKDEVWRGILQNSTLAALLLLETSDGARSMERSLLNINELQKAGLLADLERIHGQKIKEGLIEGLPLTDAPAYAVYEILTSYQLSPKAQ